MCKTKCSMFWAHWFEKKYWNSWVEKTMFRINLTWRDVIFNKKSTLHLSPGDSHHLGWWLGIPVWTDNSIYEFVEALLSVKCSLGISGNTSSMDNFQIIAMIPVIAEIFHFCTWNHWHTPFVVSCKLCCLFCVSLSNPLWRSTWDDFRGEFLEKFPFPFDKASSSCWHLVTIKMGWNTFYLVQDVSH